jgi:SAM-dependent methyltransferase
MMASSAVVEAPNCPHCRTVSDTDFIIYGRTYYHCPSCDLIFAKQITDNKAAIAHYRDDYFDACARDQMSEQRKHIYRQALAFLGKFQKPGSLLDIGCGCGFFLKEAKDHGWQVLGVDPSRKSIEYSRSLIGDAAICGTLDDIPVDRQFDAIVLINVLDHIIDAFRQLTIIHRFLTPGGTLYMRFPNGVFHTFLIRLLRRFPVVEFMKSFLILHEYAFTPSIIKRCLNDLGCTDIRVLNAPLTGGQFEIGGRTFSGLIRKIMSRLTWAMFKFLEVFSGGRWVWGPSLQVVAKKRTGEGNRA